MKRRSNKNNFATMNAPSSSPQSGEANYVAQSFVLTLGIVAAFMAACRHYAWGFIGVWNGIALFFFVRAVQSGVRAVGAHMLERSNHPEEQRLMELGEGMTSSVDAVSSVEEQAEGQGGEELEYEGGGVKLGGAGVGLVQIAREVDPGGVDPGRTDRPLGPRSTH